MAGQKPTTFTPESAERIARVVRVIENRPPRNLLNPDFDLPAMGGNWQFIKITGGITGGITGCNAPDDVDAMASVQYYPGIIRQYNSEDEVWEDTAFTVWCEPAPGVILSTNDFVMGRQVRTNACVLGNSRPLFAVFKGAGCAGTINELLNICLSVTNNTNTAVSADTPVISAYQNLNVDASGGNVTLTMDDPATFESEEITIKKVDTSANTVTLAPFASETFAGLIDGVYVSGASSLVLRNQGHSLTVYKQGSNWEIKSTDRRSNISLFDRYADANNTGTAETTLYSDSIGVGTLAKDGDKIVAQYEAYTTNVATSTQQLHIYFGPNGNNTDNVIYATPALTSSQEMCFRVYIIREASGVIRATVTLLSAPTGNASVQRNRITGLTLTNNQFITVTGTAGGGAGASNQITATQGFAQLLPAA